MVRRLSGPMKAVPLHGFHLGIRGLDRFLLDGFQALDWTVENELMTRGFHHAPDSAATIGTRERSLIKTMSSGSESSHGMLEEKVEEA